MKSLRTALILGALGAAYAHAETYRFKVAEHVVPVRPGGSGLTVLHLSDTHLNARRKRLKAFLDGLPERLGEMPDLVLATGDLIEDDSGIPGIVGAMARLEARLGRFYVLGSHDYYQSNFDVRAFGKYFGLGGPPVEARRASVQELEAGLAEKGWRSLSNRSEILETEHGRIRLTGVDDPYLGRHRTDHIERAPDETLAIGLMHAPDVVSEWVYAGYDLALAGHTHAGQVRVPGIGALVTNCSLPRELAGGLHRIGTLWLHVSPGLGTGTYTPIRFNCPPEVTLLRISPSVP